MEGLSSVPEDLSLSFSGKKKHNKPSSSTNSSGDNIDSLLYSSNEYEKIRTEVLSLVTIVLPDEINNVDEMLHEFNGKEEHLLHSLRRMRVRMSDDAEERGGGGSSNGGGARMNNNHAPIDPDDFMDSDNDDNDDEQKGGGKKINMDDWQQQLDYELDDSARSSSAHGGGGHNDITLSRSNPQAGNNSNGNENGGGSQLKSPPEFSEDTTNREMEEEEEKREVVATSINAPLMEKETAEDVKVAEENVKRKERGETPIHKTLPITSATIFF